MKPSGAGIISAGVGRRFQESGVAVPKPLIPVAGRPLIGWVLEAYARAGQKSVFILLHPRSAGARAYAREQYPGLKLGFRLKATPSTLASFCLVTGRLPGANLISTVDALYEPRELGRFLKAAAKLEADAVLGVTRHRVDATSLRVQADRKGWAQTIVKGGRGPYATTGVYLVSPKLKKAAKAALKEGCGSLSSFLGLCPGLGLKVAVVEMKQVFDIDLPADVLAAERKLGKIR